MDPVFCLETLYASDADGDGSIDREEYVTFVQLQTPPGLLDDVENYVDLPPPFQLAFISLACLCNDPDYGGDPDDEGCCFGMNAAIRIPPNPETSQEDLLYLFTICARTDRATEIFLRGSSMPSQEPSPAPATIAPTPRPTPRPTLVPTGAPTLGPTDGPTDAPVSAPTNEPTEVPTRAPVVPESPTQAPVTSTPTASPTIAPTLAPTIVPTVSPTNVPTLSPSVPPVEPGAPTRAPVTASPTASPTAGPSGSPVQLPPLRARATVEYQIAVKDGQNIDDIMTEIEYLSDLLVAMNELAVEVGLETFPPGRRLMGVSTTVRRRLAVMVEIPTAFKQIVTFGTLFARVLSCTKT